MKFKHPSDTKAFIIGIVASMAGVILWDIYKYNKRKFEFEIEKLENE